MAFSGVELTDEESEQMFISAMKNQKEGMEETFTEKSLDINLVKVDKQWYIDEPSDDLLDVFTSNFISVGNEINDSMNSSSDNANQENSKTMMEKAKEDNMTLINKAVGDEITLAMIKLKINHVEEKQTISSEYSSPVSAKEGAKFVIVNAEVTNITQQPLTLEPDLVMVDDKGREFKSYSNTIGNIDDYLNYRELSPSIKEKGNWVYELSADATSYNLTVAKSGTNELYLIKLK